MICRRVVAMATVKQLDKRSGVTYVYESVSYWDKEKKKGDVDEILDQNEIRKGTRCIHTRIELGLFNYMNSMENVLLSSSMSWGTPAGMCS